MRRIYHAHFVDSLDATTAAKLFKESVHTVEISISSFCNRTCSYCPNNMVDRKTARNFMSDGIFSNIINQLGDIDYSGGIAIHRYNEPLADKEYALSRIREIKAKIPNAEIRVFTNGDYLTADFVRELREAGLSLLLVTSHALKKDNDHEIVMRRQDARLRKLGLPFEYLPVDGNGRMAIVEAGDGLKMHWHARNFNYRNNNGVLDMMDRGQSLPVDTKFVRTDPCLIPFSELQVEWDGKVLPCCNIHSDVTAHKQYILGQIDSDSNIFLVWTNSNFVAWRKELFSYKLKAAPCTTCQYGCTGDTPELRASLENYRKRIFGDEVSIVAPVPAARISTRYGY